MVQSVANQGRERIQRWAGSSQEKTHNLGGVFQFYLKGYTEHFGLLCGTKISTKWKVVTTWRHTLLSIEGHSLPVTWHQVISGLKDCEPLIIVIITVIFAKLSFFYSCHSFYISCLKFYCNKEQFFNSISLFIQSFIFIGMESCIYGIMTIFYFVAQLTPHLVIERLLTLALLSFRLLLKINKKMRKTTMSPVILDWNWRYQYELMIFNIYTDRWMQTKI